MKTEQLQPGTQAWHAHRATHFNASDAPAMLGCSPFKTRSQLLAELHSGVTPEVDAATQRRFDDGHRFEALARPLAEEIIGDDLAPVVGTAGELSASFDGLTLMGDTAWEHKSLNDELRGCMGPSCIGRDLPRHYQVQMEQQLLVSGAQRVLFMASKWVGGALVEERHCWYASDPALRAEIVAGWKQLAADLAAYRPAEPMAPAPIGRAPETLPALHIEVTGMVTASNLAEFKQTALSAIQSVNRQLTTDSHFADAEKAVKWCSDIEDRIAAAKQHALSQTASIDELFRTMDDISAEARRVRLDLDKLVKARKESIRGEIVEAAGKLVRAHHAALCTRLGQPWLYMPAYQPELVQAIKGRKTVTSLQDAVDVVVAGLKITMNAQADKMQVNMNLLREHEAFEFLFADAFKIVTKEPDDFSALVKSRVADHQAAEEKRIAAERERIRHEEVAKLAREQEARDREAARQAAEAAKPAPTPAPAVIAAPAVSSPAPAANVRPLRPAAESGATIRLGQINDRLAPIQITADGLASLGFTPVATEKASKLFRESDFPRIAAALISHIEAVCQPMAA